MSVRGSLSGLPSKRGEGARYYLFALGSSLWLEHLLSPNTRAGSEIDRRPRAQAARGQLFSILGEQNHQILLSRSLEKLRKFCTRILQAIAEIGARVSTRQCLRGKAGEWIADTFVSDLHCGVTEKREINFCT